MSCWSLARASRAAGLAASIAISISLGGCGEKNEATTQAAPQEAMPAKSAAPAPAAKADVTVAAAVDARGDAAQGAPRYAMLCASCHGAAGGSDTPIAQTLNPKPARHNDGAYMNALSDAHLFKVIKGGGPAVGKSPLMAAWGGSLTDEQIRDVIAFIRTLADPPYTTPAG